ncbi:hypothetical protein F4803DRAFT_274439 [Xylaria telfairii]|nr:hypothetical protein F4803DRAFT_274439 [Xylaria telfairii]
MSVELALAIIGAVDVGFKWGGQIRRLCSALKGAPKEIVERVVRVETCCIRISAQLDFSRRTADLMDDDHRALHHRTLNILIDKLQAVYRELNAVQETEAQATPIKHAAPMIAAQPLRVDPALTTRRIKYAFKKKRIDEAINDLEIWQGVFDISWLLTLKIANREVDDAVAKSPVASISTSMPTTTRLRAVIRKTPIMTAENIFLREEGLLKATITRLPFCDASVAVRKGELLILDRIECAEPAVRTVTKDVRNLGLSMRDAATGTDSFGWLRCKGVVRELVTPREAPPTTALTLVFKVPSNHAEPMSLRAALLQGEEYLASLSDKIKLAKDLARAVSYVHIFGFVHKNIRPETVLLLRNVNESPCSSTMPKTPLSLFLVGFEKFRSEDGITYRAGDKELTKSLYIHPRRQGLAPLDTYVMQHDIYSLGVCLLEIGLWESFIRYDDTGMQVVALLNGAGANGSVHLSNMHASLLTLAENKLPKRMGSKYAEVVKTCLTCLDEDNKDFSNESEFADEDGIIVGVRYVEKIIMQLNTISV